MKQIIKEFIKKNIFIIITLVTITILFEYLFILPSRILGVIIDLLQNAEANKVSIIQNIKYLIYISLGILFFGILIKYLSNVFTRRLDKKLTDKLFESILKTNYTEIQNIKNGELMSYFTKDTKEVRHFFYGLLSRITRVGAIFGVAFYFMKNVNLNLTITMIIPLVLIIIVIINLRKLVEKSFKKSREKFTLLSEFVQESTDSIRTTKAYAEENNQIEEFIRRNEEVKKSDILVDKYATLLGISVSVCLGISYAIIFFYGSNLVNRNLISIGELVAFTGYVTTIFEILYWIPKFIASYERTKISYKRLEKVFNLENEFDSFEIKNKEKINGDIVFKNLNFKYKGTEEYTLKNINLNIKEGSTVGIVGTIGSGKTTLVNLIASLYPVSQNELFIGNKDINDIDILTLRNSVCYITQDNFLFSSTIRENITLFKENFEENEIRESVKQAQFEEDLKNMKNDIYTIIGERGIELSGGQRQRVALTRAFLDKANIIIFDDTFSALDNKTEEKVLNNIKELTQNKTCIIISNRISDVKDADYIVVLDGGEIVQEGIHENLVKENGLYKKFYMQQASILYEE